VIDSHTHLASCAEPLAELLGAAESAGVVRMVTVGTDPASCAAALSAAEAHPSVYAAIGCHPNNAELLDGEQLRRDAAHPRCVAIGETGLDYYRDRSPRDAQRRAFEFQIDLAGELEKPLVIHTREAADDTITMLRDRAGGVSVIMHCFSMPERLDECLAEGWWVSFAGNVTYPKNADLAAAAARVPAERLLVETDAPYLAPQSRRGRPNQPAFIVETASFIAAQRGISYRDLEAIVAASGESVFGW
jgi:TatD DNase family protein